MDDFRLLDIPKGTVRSRVRRAKAALHAQTAELGGATRRLSVEDVESSMDSLRQVVAESA